MGATRVSIIFPYLGDDDNVREKLYQIINSTLNPSRGLKLHTSNMKPVLVVNMDTIKRGVYSKFEDYLDKKGKKQLLDGLDILKVWSVDTCQMWLSGYGKIIDDKEKNPKDNTSCVLQLPGDLKYVRDFDIFLNTLVSLRTRVEAGFDFIIGDFNVEPQRSKYLIDLYGTYPLLYNWFPEFATEIREGLRIQRPRSEFLAANLDFLSKMLAKRRFAYEQTLAFLIHSLSDKERVWKIGRVDIGTIGDYEKDRGFREANDQIERTERMLKFLWREINGGDRFDVEKFEMLDRRSTAIREAAIVSLENFLNPKRSCSAIE